MTSNEVDWDIFDSFKELEDNKPKKETVNIIENTCKNCNGQQIIAIDGENYCSNCGEYFNNVFSVSPEYRYYGEGGVNPTRLGMPVSKLLPQSSMSTFISYNNSYCFSNIRRFHHWNAMPYKERSLWKVYNIIQKKSQQAGISKSIIEEAKAMYTTLNKTIISRGANRNGLIATCVYYACKKNNVPRSNKEIADIFGISYNIMTRGCKRFNEIWRVSDSDKKMNVKSANPLDYVIRFCSLLEMSDKYRYIIEFVVAKTIIFDYIQENTATSITAGSIYLIIMEHNLDISKKKVAEICKISEVTISKCYKKLLKIKNKILPKEFHE